MRGGTMLGMPNSGISYVDTQGPGLGVQLVPSRRRAMRAGFIVALVVVFLVCLATYVLTH
jgi:hypothetical protein